MAVTPDIQQQVYDLLSRASNLSFVTAGQADDSGSILSDSALLSDISAVGVLVKVDCSPHLNSGDLIALKLNEDAVFHPAKSISRIVRTDSKNNYGLRFLVSSQIFKSK